MRVFRSLTEIPADFGPVVATIGNFDGVHRGHRWVIDQVNQRAHELGLRSLGITFDPHPVRVLRPAAPHWLITPLAEKLEQLATTNLDAVLVLPFTQQLSEYTAEAFARLILRDALHVREVHEGENFRFGYQASTDIKGLEALGAELGFAVKTYSPQMLRGEPVSSSAIRRAIAAGAMSRTRTLLGRPFAVRSLPASGRGYGTRYAVPTINLAAYAELLPANGVYVSTLRIGSETFDAVTNIGNRPTFGANSFAVESYLLRFHPINLTPETVLELTFLKRLRGEKKWDSPEALKQQIGLDVARAERYFALCRVICDAHAQQALAG